MPYGLKRCSKCKTILPATRDHFSLDNNRRDRLNPWCKGCATANVLARQRKNRLYLNYKKRAWRKANPQREADQKKREPIQMNESPVKVRRDGSEES